MQSGKTRSFQAKLFRLYAGFTLPIVLLFLCVFYWYSQNVFQNNYIRNMEHLIQLHSDKLDSAVREMDQITVDILADNNTISLLEGYHSGEIDAARAANQMLYIINQYTFNRSIFTGSISKVRVFTENGFFISNDRSNLSDALAAVKVPTVPWLSRVSEAYGGKIILPARDSEWTQLPDRVFSVTRMIRTSYTPLGFVEVQQPESLLREICEISPDGIQHVFLIDPEGELIYSTAGASEPDHLAELKAYLTDGSDAVQMIQNVPMRMGRETIYYIRSSYTGITLVCLEDAAYVGRAFGAVRNAIFLAGILLAAAALAFSHFLSYSLSRPLRMLERIIQNTNIDNLDDTPETITSENSYTEIYLLASAFREMKERLDSAITTERELQAMQAEAQFSVLQAQINPHFLYNMLNVLVDISEEHNVPELSNVCRRMARSLRYSSGGAGNRVTLQDELQHTRDYLIMMKLRFESQLDYRIEVPPEMMALPVPKLVVQPIVENALSHGYDLQGGVRHIELLGSVENGRWQLRVLDNGCGFSEEALHELHERMKQYIQALGRGKRPQRFGIGGMGLISTMARLRFFYGDEFDFQVANRPEGGASVTLSGIFHRGETG